MDDRFQLIVASIELFGTEVMEVFGKATYAAQFCVRTVFDDFLLHQQRQVCQGTRRETTTHLKNERSIAFEVQQDMSRKTVVFNQELDCINRWLTKSRYKCLFSLPTKQKDRLRIRSDRWSEERWLSNEIEQGIEDHEWNTYGHGTFQPVHCHTFVQATPNSFFANDLNCCSYRTEMLLIGTNHGRCL